jgi:MFS family permease
LTLIVSARERLNESALFLYFGVAVLCLASRTPDIKHNLNVNNGTYGVLISLGAIGAVIAFMFVGQLTHRFGVGRLLVITGTLTFGSIALIPHIHTAWIFVAVNILLAAGFNSYNIALHHQALKRQLLSGEKNLPRLHGAWSLGTLLTTLISIAVTSHVSLAWHVDALMAILWFGTMTSIFAMRPFLVVGSTEYTDDEIVKVRDTWSMLTRDRYIAIAYVCAVMVEFSSNDWVTLSSHQEIKASTTLSIVPYLTFIVGMTIGRLGIHKLFVKKPEIYWIRIASRVGGSGFIIFLLLAKFFSSRNFGVAFTCEILGFFLGGICGSFFAGVLTQFASQRSTFPGGVVVAQIGLAIAVLTFAVKIVISWVIQVTSITYGLMIPGVLMIAFSLFKKLEPQETLHSLAP